MYSLILLFIAIPFIYLLIPYHRAIHHIWFRPVLAIGYYGLAIVLTRQAYHINNAWKTFSILLPDIPPFIVISLVWAAILSLPMFIALLAKRKQLKKYYLSSLGILFTGYQAASSYAPGVLLFSFE